MKERSKVTREVKVPFRTCPSPPVPIWLLQLYVEAGLLIVLLMVNYSNGYGLPADERVQTVGGEVRGHALVHQHTFKHTHGGRQTQSDRTPSSQRLNHSGNTITGMRRR